MTNIKLHTPTQRQAMARLLVKNIPGSIERKKKQLEELQAEIAVLEYNLREAERILAAPPSQPGVGGGGEPDDTGVAKIATPVKLTPALQKTLETVVQRGDKGTWSKRQAENAELNEYPLLKVDTSTITGPPRDALPGQFVTLANPISDADDDADPDPWGDKKKQYAAKLADGRLWDTPIEDDRSVPRDAPPAPKDGPK